jgi:hypothetical protein
MIRTPFGAATLVEEVKVLQSAADASFASLVQLLETEGGDALVRVCYSTGGVARRGPVTFRRADLRRLGKMLAKAPRLRAIVEEAAPPR